MTLSRLRFTHLLNDHEITSWRMLLHTHSSSVADLLNAKEIWHSLVAAVRNKCLLLSMPTLSVKHKGNSLIAPVEPYGDVPLDLTSLVLCEMTLDQLPTQVDELVHHMTQLVEQIHLVFLLKQPKKDLLRIVNSYCSIYVKTITKTLQSIYLIFSVLLIV